MKVLRKIALYAKRLVHLSYKKKKKIGISNFKADDIKNQKNILKQKNSIIDEYIFMTISDLEGRILEISQAYLEFTGFEKDEVVGKTHSIFRNKDTDVKVIENLWNTIIDNKTFKGDIKNYKRSGEEYWIHAIIRPLYDQDKVKIGYMAIKEDITERKRLEELSITDALTTLYNRRYFDQYVKRELKRSTWKEEKFALVIIDIDFFKGYNDFYGHKEGDTALKQVSKEMKRNEDTVFDAVFRIGGEEFAAVIINRDDEFIHKCTNKLLKDIESLKIRHEKNNVSEYLTISMGVVNLDTSKYHINSDDIYNLADENLYKAKEDGRNRVVFGTDKSYIDSLNNIDSFTRLPNRESLIHDLALLEDESMFIILHINQVNELGDLYGYDVVNKMILEKVEQIKGILVDEDTYLYNLNYQEFALLVTNKALFEKYLSLLKYSIFVDSIEECNIMNKLTCIAASFTAGIAYGHQNIFNKADMVLQEAISEKKSYKVYKNNKDIKEEAINRMITYKSALHNGNIVPYFQPIVDTVSGKVLKYEALARIKADDGRIVVPNDFLEAAKEDKTFEYFTRQMMQKVFNVYENNNVEISINITYDDICSASMINYIKNRLEKYGGDNITFELIESEDIKDYTIIEEFIIFVKEYGCKISIDGFGSGYSNFSNIIKLNIDYIKLDGSLIEKINIDENVKQMIEGILIFAKNAKIKTVAECVSSKELADSVKKLGVDYTQGYFYGEPQEAKSYNLA